MSAMKAFILARGLSNKLGIDHLNYRLKWMLFGWGFVGIMYIASHYVQQQGLILPLTWVDVWLPYQQWALWPYLSFFVLIPWAYLRGNIQLIQWLAHAMQLSAVLAAVLYFLYPTTMKYPTIDASTFNGQILQVLVEIDSRQNCLPSLHAALALLAVISLVDRRKFGCTLLYVLWFIIISLSIIILRRHLFVDWLLGSYLALFAGWYVAWFPNRKKAF